jgi:ABC-type transport system involved in multi-copper enzyme maturation permease subunit
MGKKLKLSRSIAVELLKLRRKKLPILIPGVVLFSILTAYLPSISTGWFDWQELFSASMFVFSEVLFLLLGYVTGLVFAGEYEYGTMEPLLSTPVSIAEIVVGKLAAIVCVSFATALSAFAFTLCSRLIFTFGPIPPGLVMAYAKTLIIVVLIHLAFVPAYILASVSTKRVIYPAVFGMAMVAVMMIFAVAKYANYIPSCFPILIQVEMLGKSAYTREFLRTQELASVEPLVAISMLSVIAALPIPFCCRFLRRY